MKWLILLLLLPSSVYGDCFQDNKQNSTPVFENYSVKVKAKALSRCKGFRCLVRKAKHKRTNAAFLWKDSKSKKVTATWGTLGWAKSVAVGPIKGFRTINALWLGTEVANLGSEEADGDIAAHWSMVNEIRCEYHEWCRFNVPFTSRRACSEDISKLPHAWKTLRATPQWPLGEYATVRIR